MITQASSEHSICIGIKDSEANKAKKIVDEAFRYEIENLILNPCFIVSESLTTYLLRDSFFRGGIQLK